MNELIVAYLLSLPLIAIIGAIIDAVFNAIAKATREETLRKEALRARLADKDPEASRARVRALREAYKAARSRSSLAPHR